MVDMDTACLTEYLKDKKMSLDEFKKLDRQSDQYKNLIKGYEPFFNEWKKNKQQKEDKNSENKKDDKAKTLTINEIENQAENSKENNTPNQDNSWKESFAKEWRIWGTQQGLEFKDASIPTRENQLSFRFYEKDQKDYAAEITYSSPYNLSIRGSDGKIPDNKYFEKAVNMAIQNGTAIEFGNISSPEFKAKLLAACYNQGTAQIINAPTAEEMAKWPEHLKKMVADARNAAMAQQKSKQSQQQEDKPQPKTSAAQSKIAELRARIQARDEKIEKAKIEAKASGKSLSDAEIASLNQEGLSAEEKKLRDLRKQSREGNQEATKELYARREKSLTDDFKYERVIKEDEKGNKIYKDGKPEYLKKEDGSYVYKEDENGKPILSEAYKTFLTKLGKTSSR